MKEESQKCITERHQACQRWREYHSPGKHVWRMGLREDELSIRRRCWVDISYDHQRTPNGIVSPTSTAPNRTLN